MFTCLGISILVNNLTPWGRQFWQYLNENYSEFAIHVWWQLGISTAVYWLWSLPFFVLDVFKWPASLRRYKIQPAKEVGLKEYAEIAKVVIRNQICVNLPLAVAMYYLGKWRGVSTRPEDLPGPLATVGTYFLGLACTEIGFFYVHKKLHEPKYYKAWHKQHHLWTAPVGLAATYASTLEHLLSNLIPPLFAPFVLGSHLSTFFLNLNILQLGTIVSHSDYHLPGLHNSTVHDYHHYSFTQNYGPTGLLDSYYGTNKEYIKWLDGYRKRYGEAHFEREAKNDLARARNAELEERERREVEAGRKLD
ncbi:C-4 methylsterol oxidase [Hyaloraphidium curvatum]|nr:C-4 methylsterol oxidase [Hyaloraphidium curvatum]